MDTAYTLRRGQLEIPCRLTTPDSGEPARLVLGVHGLAGSAADPIQGALAEEMSLFFSAVFRFDFPGHGESPMDCDSFTVKNCADALLAVAQDARSRYPQAEDLCIFATGFGAYITLISLPALMALPGQIKLVVQTPSVQMHETLLAMVRMSKETFRVRESITFPTKRPLTIRYSFYEELARHSAMTEHPIPMLILHSEDDSFIQPEHIRYFRDLNENAKLVIIPGTSHQFMEDGAWDMVLDLTRDWFDFEQVVLADWE